MHIHFSPPEKVYTEHQKYNHAYSQELKQLKSTLDQDWMERRSTTTDDKVQRLREFAASVNNAAARLEEAGRKLDADIQAKTKPKEKKEKVPKEKPVA